MQTLKGNSNEVRTDSQEMVLRFKNQNELVLAPVPVAEKRSAEFSEDRRYRYTLTIRWDYSKPLVQFIGLNPSTADEVRDDPTVRRCKAFARSWGAGGMTMTNLFAYRATDPKEMKRQDFPIGDENDMALSDTARKAWLVILCWGTHGAHMGRGKEVTCNLGRIPEFKPKLHYLGLTNGGFPKHPLYLRKDLKPIPLYEITGKSSALQIRASNLQA